LASLPVRVRLGPPCQRRSQDRRGDVRKPELRDDLCDVDALGERELLVWVADAVSPGDSQLLYEERAPGVLDARLRHGNRHALAEALLPVAGDAGTGTLVRGGV